MNSRPPGVGVKLLKVTVKYMKVWGRLQIATILGLGLVTLQLSNSSFSTLYMMCCSPCLVPGLYTGQMMFTWSYSHGRLPSFTVTMVGSSCKLAVVVFQYTFLTLLALVVKTMLVKINKLFIVIFVCNC